MRGLLALCLLLIALTAAHADAPPPQWLPRESWPGGKQYDPRLERTVKFWGTGVPAADLFASVAGQTGVALAFSPADDDNARICLNVYLNPKEPPALRALLVQIGWVMDCAWAVEGEGEQSRYVLLHASIGDGVLERLQQEMEREAADREQRRQEAISEAYPIVLAKLQEIDEARELSREEVLARYRGKDDLMALALLDPERRALAEFCFSLAKEVPLQMYPYRGLEWTTFSAEQRALLRQALRRQMEILAQAAREGILGIQGRWEDWEWVEQELMTVRVRFLGTGFWVWVDRRPARGQPAALGMPVLQLHSDPRLGLPTNTVKATIELRRLLGEEVSQEEEYRLAAEAEGRRSLAARQASVEEQLRTLCHLSPEAEARLSSLELPTPQQLRAPSTAVQTRGPDAPQALWHLQEGVAVWTGMHVISDCFRQPARSIRREFDTIHPEQSGGANVLQFLQAHCVTADEHARRPIGGPPYDWLAVAMRREWGDAGEFLRFRSADREVWRAAFLPPDVVATLDAWLEPHLRADLAWGEGVVVPLDIRKVGGLMRRLSYLQRSYGGVLTYGRPTEETEPARHLFRTTLLRTVQNAAWFYALVGALSDAQWEQAHAEGLRLDAESPVEPPSDGLRERDAPSLEGTVLHIAPVDEATKAKRRSWMGASDWCGAEFYRDDARVEQQYLVTELTLRSYSWHGVAHLVSPPQEYAE